MSGSDRLKPVIFLLGNVRSGTSLTRKLFALHPDLATLREPRTVWMFADPGRRHDRFTEADATPRVIRYIRRRFEEFQAEHGGKRLMEKTPSNVLRIPYIHRIFPESRFLYTVREPLAYLSSSDLKWQPKEAITKNRLRQRLRETPRSQLHYYAWRYAAETFNKKVLKKKYVSVWGVRYPGIYDDLRRLTRLEVMAKQWAESSRQAEEDLAALDPAIVFRTSYEKLVTNPVEEFTRILNHFGLEMSPAMSEQVRTMVDPNRRMKWTRFDPEDIRRVLPILRPEMERHGYEVPHDWLESAR